jgi:hypothetical protein
MFTSPEILSFSATSSIDANVGFGNTVGYDRFDLNHFCGGWVLQSDGQCQGFDGSNFAGTGFGTYTSQTVFGVSFDTGYIVLYKDNVEVMRILSPTSVNILNVTINTSGGTINNINITP